MQYHNVNPNQNRGGCCKDRVNWKEMPDRTIITNMPDRKVCDNTISSTNSNVFTFIPLNLISQMSKPANVYFVVIAVLQTIQAISNTNGKPLVLIPLIFVTFTVLVKDAYEQFYRYLKDREENNRETTILAEDGFRVTTVEKLRIGDIVRVDKDEQVPCDIVILQSSDEKGRSYVETKNLDGETNLKTKKAPACRYGLKNLHPPQLYHERFELNYEKPNPFMHSFNGNIKIKDESLPLNVSSLILKGSSLKNVMWTVGVCVYTGRETKLALNSVKFKEKRSRLEKEVNQMVVLIFVMQFLLSLVCAVMNILLEGNKVRELNGLRGSEFWAMVGTWWLMMTYFIPISLVVTLELVKLFQGNYMIKDNRMWSTMTETLPMMNNSTVNENLGQIKYIFSDKTGTLTSNVMNFKCLSTGGRIFGEQSTLTDEQLDKLPKVTNVQFRDAQFIRDGMRYQDVFNVLTLCHEVIVEKDEGKSSYNSSSPDEIALINFTKLCGYEYLGEQHERMLIYNRSEDRMRRFLLLAHLEFTSDRKRMSVLVQDETGAITLLTKGADNLVSKLLNPTTPHLKETQNHINSFSSKGLRTLMLAKRVISAQEYRSWRIQYDRAACSLHDREKLLSNCYDLIQKNMQLVGATAVEDKLQDNVSDTIQKIRQCNITFYILTGDKKETAVNIGRSCGMILPDTEVLLPPEDDAQLVMRWLKERSPLPTNSVLLINASLPLPTIPLHPTICYRCTPTQKEVVIKSVKSQTDELTLAIGDGSNDVNMITTAHVGIGIKGKEGNEVCRVSDFVLGQFSLLSPLILYYGRQWYRRNSKLVNYSFFKNIYHVMAIVGYGSWSFFSGNVLFQPIMYQFFNVFFASLPIMAWAVVDEEYSMEQSMNLPTVYSRGQDSDYFNQWTYWKNILIGTVYGIVSMLVVYCVMETGVVDANGRISYQAESAMILYFSMVMVVNVKVLLMSHGHTPLLLFCVGITFALYWVFYAVNNRMFPNNEILQSFDAQFHTPMIYLVHFLLAFVALITDFTFKKYYEFDKMYEYRQQYVRRTSVQRSVY